MVVGCGRAVVAGLLAALVLAVVDGRVLPPRHLWRPLSIVVLGVVFGFPLLTALALDRVPAAHGIVVVGLLPAGTAVFAVVRGGERPSLGFWLAALAGLAVVLAFAVTQGADGFGAADLMLLAGVAVCSLSYAEGGVVAREVGGWRTICWALVLGLPVMAVPTIAAIGADGLHAGAASWAGFAYVALISMFTAFFAWYHALALGGIARIGQIQLAQAPLSLVVAALVLGEAVSAATALTTLAVLACVVATQRARVERAELRPPAPPRDRLRPSPSSPRS